MGAVPAVVNDQVAEEVEPPVFFATTRQKYCVPATSEPPLRPPDAKVVPVVLTTNGGVDAVPK